MIAQIAALAALKNIDYMHDYVVEVTENKEWISHELTSLGFSIQMSGGNYIFFKVGSKKIAKLKAFLKVNKIYIRDFMHNPNICDYVRISIGTKYEMEQVLQSLKLFLKESYA
jgi:histidinol-phosphate aminotransferase